MAAYENGKCLDKEKLEENPALHIVVEKLFIFDRRVSKSA